MDSPTFVLFGSGPGIGLATAKAFARRHFAQTVLVARNAERLASEKAAVVEAAKQAGKDVEVFTFPTDLSDLAALRKTLHETEKLGLVGAVYHNAARIKFADHLTTSVE